LKQGQKPERYWLAGWQHRLRGQISDEAIRQLKQEPNAASIIYELVEELGVEVARETLRRRRAASSHEYETY